MESYGESMGPPQLVIEGLQLVLLGFANNLSPYFHLIITRWSNYFTASFVVLAHQKRIHACKSVNELQSRNKFLSKNQQNFVYIFFRFLFFSFPFSSLS